MRQTLPTKVATPKDTNNFQGVATVSDCRNKRLKLSCGHGDEELLDLNGQPRELVESVSPMWDCMEQDMPKMLASLQSSTVSVQGYKVKKVNASILKAIFKIYGDIAADVYSKLLLLLMKTKANTSLVTRATRMDLKSAKERVEKAERCVKELDLVEKKLHENFLESKAEKDFCAKQPVLLAT
ncbi:hypothetical protein Tco_0576923 [Tanacetum coccineum]